MAFAECEMPVAYASRPIEACAHASPSITHIRAHIQGMGTGEWEGMIEQRAGLTLSDAMLSISSAFSAIMRLSTALMWGRDGQPKGAMPALSRRATGRAHSRHGGD